MWVCNPWPRDKTIDYGSWVANPRGLNYLLSSRAYIQWDVPLVDGAEAGGVDGGVGFGFEAVETPDESET